MPTRELFRICTRSTTSLFISLVPLFISSRASANDWTWVVSTDTQRSVNRPAITPTSSPMPEAITTGTPATQPDLTADLNQPAQPLTIVIDPTATAQKIDGFGGCFNEIGWRALLRLDEEDRSRILHALFDDKDGLGLNYGRLPIGASDFALSPYSLDDVPGDLEMKHFSIERDRYLLIPYIKAAQAIRPDLKLWGSPWSPPAWMKTSGVYNGGNLRQEPAILKAYALYLAKFVEEYHREGIEISAVHFQNEPAIESKYPSCPWPDPATARDFIRDYAGPTFAQRNVSAKIWLGTITNKNFNWFKTILDDPRVMKTIGGIGIQYNSRDPAAQVHAAYPGLTMMETETKCFNGHNDWLDAEETFRQMTAFFRGGVSSYMYWNMVLDQTGLSSWAWSQDSTIVVDSYDGSLTYTPQYVLM